MDALFKGWCMSSISKDVLAPIEALSGDGNNRVRVEFRRLTLPSNRFLVLLAVPMLVALGISGYLTYVSLTAAKILGCDGGSLFNCSHVIYSKWSKVFGIPVSALALGTYVAMIAAAAVTSIRNLSRPARLMSWSAVTGLAIAAALAGLYFIYLQVFVLEHLCPWCLGAHTCGLLIAGVILFSRSRIALPPLVAVSGLAAAGLAMMIGIQINSEEPKKYEELVYTPPVKTQVDEAGTFTSAPGDFDAAPGEDDGMMLPPGMEDEDEDLFAPPIEEDDSFIEPPSEDDEDVTAFQLRSLNNFQLGLLGQLAVTRNPLSLVMVLQEPAMQEKGKQQQNQAAGKAQDPKKKKAKKQAKNRIIEFMGRKLNAYQWPIDGSPEAKHIFVEMFDYTCPHCRTTSKAIFAAKENMGDELAVVVLPVPMNTACNPSVTRDHAVHLEACQLSELAVAMWRCDAAKFSEWHRWMFEGKDSPNYVTALAKATELVGKDRLEKELKKKTAKAYVKSHCKMYQTLNGGPIPKILFPRRAIQGEFTAVDTLTTMIKEQAAKK